MTQPQDAPPPDSARKRALDRMSMDYPVVLEREPDAARSAGQSR